MDLTALEAAFDDPSEMPKVARCKQCGTRYVNHVGLTCSKCKGPLEEISVADLPLVLLIEDSPLDQLKFRKCISNMGCQVRVEENGLLALKWLETSDTVPDLIVLDVMMPVRGGMETLEDIRSHPALVSVPVVFLSGKGELSIVRAALRRGPTDYILKDSGIHEVTERLARALKR